MFKKLFYIYTFFSRYPVEIVKLFKESNTTDFDDATWKAGNGHIEIGMQRTFSEAMPSANL